MLRDLLRQLYDLGARGRVLRVPNPDAQGAVEAVEDAAGETGDVLPVLPDAVGGGVVEGGEEVRLVVFASGGELVAVFLAARVVAVDTVG